MSDKAIVCFFAFTTYDAMIITLTKQKNLICGKVPERSILGITKRERTHNIENNRRTGISNIIQRVTELN